VSDDATPPLLRRMTTKPTAISWHVLDELTFGSNTTVPPGCKATFAAAEVLKAKRASERAGTFIVDGDETGREIKRLMGETSADGKRLKQAGLDRLCRGFVGPKKRLLNILDQLCGALRRP
jgi:hypothetical protein